MTGYGDAIMKIGTCVKGENLISELPSIIEHGFETVEVYFDRGLSGIDLVSLAKKAAEISENKVSFSSIGIYVNPLQSSEQRHEVENCIDCAAMFGAGVVSTFAGAIEGASVPESIGTFKAVFDELTERAEYNGVKIGIENAHSTGFWYRATNNIGFCPGAWELMFDAVNSNSLGLTWEPSHQIEQFIDVYSQLEDWTDKIVHVHGKDGKIDTEHVKKYGVWFGQHYCNHRFPGFGDSDWTRIMGKLKESGYEGDIVTEGFHDPEYRGEREMEGQLLALDYLKKCRKMSDKI